MEGDEMAASLRSWSRGEAICRLRERLIPMTDDEHSLCQVAAERGIFCRGFRRWNASEFDRRWRDHIGRSTHLSRAQMEQYANLWQLAETGPSSRHSGLRRPEDLRSGSLSRLERILERRDHPILC